MRLEHSSTIAAVLLVLANILSGHRADERAAAAAAAAGR